MATRGWPVAFGVTAGRVKSFHPHPRVLVKYGATAFRAAGVRQVPVGLSCRRVPRTRRVQRDSTARRVSSWPNRRRARGPSDEPWTADERTRVDNTNAGQTTTGRDASPPPPSASTGLHRDPRWPGEEAIAFRRHSRVRRDEQSDGVHSDQTRTSAGKHLCRSDKSDARANRAPVAGLACLLVPTSKVTVVLYSPFHVSLAPLVVISYLSLLFTTVWTRLFVDECLCLLLLYSL